MDPTGDDNAITVLLPREAEQLDPRFVADAYGLKLSRLLFASLVTIDSQTLAPVPDLAESIETVSPTEYIVRLRDNLRFSDGSSLDADDVIATFQGVVDPTLGSRYARTFARVARMDRIDERTIRFVLDEPHATFLTDLEFPIVRVEDAHRRIDLNGGTRPVGAGPYVLSSRTPHDVQLIANRHWHGGTPLHPKVRFVTVRDDNVRAMRLHAEAGDVAINAVPPLLVPMFEDDPRFAIRTAPGISTTYIGFNLEKKVLADAKVRRAIAHAIDVDALVQSKHRGRARRASSWIPAGHWAWIETPTYAFDPTEAAALLDEAGLVDPDGSGPAPRARLLFRTTSDRFRASICRAIAAMLADVSIEVEVRPTETATLLADLNQGRFDLTLLQVPEVIEPHVLSWFFASDRIPGPQQEGANRWRYRNDALDAAFERGRATSDREDRKASYATVQTILAKDLPVLPLWQQDLVAVVRTDVQLDVPRDGRFGTLARRAPHVSVTP